MAAMLAISDGRQPGQWYSNLWIVDDYNIFFHVVFFLIAGDDDSYVSGFPEPRKHESWRSTMPSCCLRPWECS